MTDVVVIGAGQAALAVGYYLRRTGLSFELLDAEAGPGGAWRHTWNSLRLFSPARWSSLPGWIMPGGPDTYPSRDDVLTYLAAYEERYQLPLRRPVRVQSLQRGYDRLVLNTDVGTWAARAVVSATGTWANPVIPTYPGRAEFRGVQIHSAFYRSPEPFAGQRVLVVGGGNSGAQILADVSEVADTTWVTPREPTFLPDDVDGRDLFDWATERYRARLEGRQAKAPQGGLGNVVMVAPVREARDRGDLKSVRPFKRLTEAGVVWRDGRETAIDTIIWCTGFQPALGHLEGLGVLEPDGYVDVAETRSTREPRLWLVGYGEWTGYASATLVGVGRSARATAADIADVLKTS